MTSVLKATTENKTTSVTTHFKEINNKEQRVYCLTYNNSHSDNLHQMFNLFALLWDDPLKPATPVTNGAINETLQQFATLKKWQLPASAGWLSWIVDVDRPSVEGHPKQRNRLDSSPGCLGATCEARWTRRSHAAGIRRCVPGSMWRRAVLLQTSVKDASATPAGCDSYFGQ